MYSILICSIQTSTGKLVVCQDAHHNSQKIWEKLVKLWSKSTAAKHATDEIMTYLTTTHLDPTTIHVPLVEWLTYWEEQVHCLCNYRPTALNDETLKILLENAVSQHPELEAHKTLELDILAQSGIAQAPMGYNAYLELLKSHAATLDKASRARSKSDYQSWCLANYLDLSPANFRVYSLSTQPSSETNHNGESSGYAVHQHHFEDTSDDAYTEDDFYNASDFSGASYEVNNMQHGTASRSFPHNSCDLGPVTTTHSEVGPEVWGLLPEDIRCILQKIPIAKKQVSFQPGAPPIGSLVDCILTFPPRSEVHVVLELRLCLLLQSLSGGTMLGCIIILPQY